MGKVNLEWTAVLPQLSENKTGRQRGFVVKLSISLTARNEALVLDLHPLSIIHVLNISRHSSECHGYLPQDV